jgi:arylsulfatase A-like enzyme
MLSLRCVMICVAVLGAVAAQDGERPNIVWLVAEDMSPWLGCYGDATVPTPNCDRLAREGVRYRNAFATSPVCAPARSSLITGMYATRIGTMQMRNNAPSAAALDKNPDAYREIPGYEGLPPAFVRCFPEVLRRHGYYCSNNSKRDYQFAAPVTVWDESSGRAHWRNRAAGQRFFAVFNYNGTHESQSFPDSKAKPRVVSPDDVPIPPIYPDTANVRQAMARTYDNIAAMDQWVGEKLAELDDAGLRESTIVMFFSDHGVGLPRGKRSCYDTGTRVPLLVRFPGKRLAGTIEDRVVQFVDFGPTVLSLCGIRPDDRLDGRAFLGGSERDGIGHAFSHADRFDEVYDRQRSVTDGRYRYIRNYLTDPPYLIANASLPCGRHSTAGSSRPTTSGSCCPSPSWCASTSGRQTACSRSRHRRRCASSREATPHWSTSTVQKPVPRSDLASCRWGRTGTGMSSPRRCWSRHRTSVTKCRRIASVGSRRPSSSKLVHAPHRFPPSRKRMVAIVIDEPGRVRRPAARSGSRPWIEGRRQ